MKRRDFLRCVTGAGLGAMTGVGCVHRTPEGSDRAGKGLRTPDRAALEKAAAFVESECRAKRFPGAALVVTHHAKVCLERYVGTYCNGKERALPFDGSVRNLLCSFSKPVSATVVAMAHQDGKLDYDVPVSTYIPEFTGGGKESITLRHLLTHSAGIPSVVLGQVLTDEQWAEALRVVCAAKTEWAPGSRTAYHALSGMFVAAEAVRRVSDMKPWKAICQERLFDPIGAKSMTYGLPPEGASYAISPQPKELPADMRSGVIGLAGHPAGGCFGTPADMLRFLQLHLNLGQWHGKTLLRRDEAVEMQRVQYAAQIDAAVAAGAKPTHEFWGLSWLLRGTTTTGWFGFGDKVSPRAFGHAGVDTVIGIADPDIDMALAFVTTDSPGPPEETVRVRNTVTNLVAAAFYG